MQNDYNEITKFNITKLIEQMYLSENTNSDFFNSINFSETSSVEYIYKSENFSQPTTVKESLAQNLISHLPLLAYKKYITADWLEFGKDRDYPLSSESLSGHKIDFLDHLSDLCFEKSKKDFNYFAQYKRLFLNKVLDVDKFFNYKHNISEKTLNSYYKLLKKCLFQYKTVQENFSSSADYKNEVLTEPWLFSIARFTENYSADKNQYLEDATQILNKVAKNPEAYLLVDDIINQLEKAENGSLPLKVNNKVIKFKTDTRDLILNKSEVLPLSIIYNNHNLTSKLQTFLKVDNQFLATSLDKYITKVLDSYLKDSPSDVENLKINELAKSILSLDKKSKSFRKLKTLGLLALSDNLEAHQYVRDNIDLDSVIIDKKYTVKKDSGLTCKDCIVVAWLMNAYKDDFLENNDIRKKPMIWQIGNGLIKIGLEPDLYVNWPKLTDTVKNNVLMDIKQSLHKLPDDFTKNMDNFDVWAQNFFLENSLQEDSVKKVPQVKL